MAWYWTALIIVAVVFVIAQIALLSARLRLIGEQLAHIRYAAEESTTHLQQLNQNLTRQFEMAHLLQTEIHQQLLALANTPKATVDFLLDRLDGEQGDKGKVVAIIQHIWSEMYPR
jgi:CBS domain containing-hemolysin-like protein